VPMALEHAGGRSADGLAIGDVAGLVLVRCRGAAREPDDERPACLQGAHELRADAGARPGDDRYRQILSVRPAAALFPDASVRVATRCWVVPFFRRVVFHGTA
jgi:hypothetical protein